MAKIFRLIDLQKMININHASPDILAIKPISVNYRISENFIFPGYKVSSISKKFYEGTMTLGEHLKLRKINDNCLLKISEPDIYKIDSVYM